MGRILGIGGLLFRADDPVALAAWYRDVLGLDLDARLAAAGAEVAPGIEDMPGVGRFSWVTDPEGSRIELWEQS
jgi:predicted enzyme related to lactoylglutathione lyase